MPRGRKRKPLIQKMAWFVLSVDSGMDNRVRKDLKRQVKIQGMEKQVGRIIVPKALQTAWVNDKEVTQRRMAFPGYLLINCKFSDDVFHLIRGVRGTNGLLMNPTNPTPLETQEAAVVLVQDRMKKLIESRPDTCQVTEEVISSKYGHGDQINITDGIFAGYDAVILKVRKDGTIVGGLSIWGKRMEVELTEDQIKKV